ncbi:DegV family protein [Butyrivibrio sp. INlla16]|uniref:DegV family protein n=1 Tax=Butyrivibrio sp. INlla16 TaxID=1520807 RepID=UPI00087E6ECD|nr:DegV family protein [Butyrivibrio sp. INlla16]SDB50184.1 EDD domain protein, DegV family [Butyrivibrio sp. INlla16]
MIRIISDSTCDLSKELKDRFNISILPLHVIADKDHLDGIDISPDELYKWADANHTTPKTAAPAVYDATEMFKRIIDAGDEIIAFSISSSMSSSYNNMRLAASELGAEDKISVIDSANLSTGVGLLVLHAAKLASEGISRDQIVEKINDMIPYVRASFVVDTLTYLYRGGRCSGVAALAGGMLKLHPCIKVSNGAMQVGKKYRGKYQKIVLNYVKDLEPALLNARDDFVFITHSGISEEVIFDVKTYLQELGVFKEIFITRAGSVISSHCGYGTLGVLFIEKKR